MTDIDPRLIKEILSIKEKRPRDPQRAKLGSEKFIAEARKIAKNVSFSQDLRHTGVRGQKQAFRLFMRKESSPMFNTITSIIIALSLVLGSGVATVAASQTSIPGDLLYEVKLASESIEMDLTSDPISQFALALELVQERADEINTLLLEGTIPTEAVQTRYKAQIEQAMAIAAGLSGENAVPALEQLQIQLEAENRAFTENQKNASPLSESAMAQVRTMLEERMRMIETGQTNLLQLRQQLQVQEQLNNPDQGQQGENSVNGNGQQDSTTTGGGNPWVEGTPTPNSSYGPGPGECESTCTPQGDGQGNNPQTYGTPVPNASYGYGQWWLTLTPGANNGKR
jgi:hypothetical protein